MLTHNHEEFIEQSITSALDQKVGFDYEIVVGEDCSADSTANILRRLEARHSGRLKVEYREKNLGVEVNFLKTLAACRGEYVAFLEGDDFWTSNDKLELQVGFLDQYKEASFCFHRTRTLNSIDQSTEFVLPAFDPPALSSIDFLIQESNPVALSSVMAHRSYLSGLSDWIAGLNLCDWPLCLMLACKGRVGYIPMEMSRYRVHCKGSWSSLNSHLRVAYVIQMLDRVSRLMSGNERDLIERRKAELADWWAGDLICTPSAPLDALVDKLNRSGDCELSTYLLLKVTEVARKVQQAALWHEQQSRAWEATSAQLTTQLSASVAELSLDAKKLEEWEGRIELVASDQVRKWLAGFRPR